eukprot:7167948-Pyramimonas_sp.AAC.1
MRADDHFVVTADARHTSESEWPSRAQTSFTILPSFGTLGAPRCSFRNYGKSHSPASDVTQMTMPTISIPRFDGLLRSVCLSRNYLRVVYLASLGFHSVR